MAAEAAGAPSAVRLTRMFAAPPERVFDAWTRPEQMTKWFGRATNGPLVEVVVADVRPGGRWRTNTICPPDNIVYRMQGTYREVKRPERLVFTWHWEGADFADSVVTIELRRLGTSNFTELTITHDLLPEKWREDHKQGWVHCFALLDEVLKEAQ